MPSPVDFFSNFTMCLIGLLIPVLGPRKRSPKHKRKPERRQHQIYDDLEKSSPPYQDTNVYRDLAPAADHTEPRVYATLEEDFLACEQIRHKERVRLLGEIEREMDRLEREYDRRQLFEPSLLPLANSSTTAEQKVLVEQDRRVTSNDASYYQDTPTCHCYVCHNLRRYSRQEPTASESGRHLTGGVEAKPGGRNRTIGCGGFVDLPGLESSLLP